MRYFRVIFVIAVILSIGFISCDKQNVHTKSFTEYVDPFIGTGDHGHVFVGANVPFGFVQLGPTQTKEGWDWCSGYNYSDTTLRGFSHLHLSGTGIGDLGDVTFMPVNGSVSVDSFASSFSRQTEKCRPGYYAVHVNNYDVDVQLTATKRVGFHKYTYTKDKPSLIIDLAHGIGWDSPVEGCLIQETDRIISGYRYSRGWAPRQRVYFTAVFSKPVKIEEYHEIAKSKAWNTDSIKTDSETPTYKARALVCKANVDIKPGEDLLFKVALSPVSIDNAKENLKIEIPSWDFEKYVKFADSDWNEELSKIAIETPNKDNRTIFYTAMYHSMCAPSVFCDLNGEYSGADGKTYRDKSFTNYTTFSLWDTYRAAHPLMTIIHTEKMKDISKTMLNIYSQQGKLPVWHLVGNETNCMVGNPGVIVLADMIIKGYVGDVDLAYTALKNSVLKDDRGLDLLKEYGYIPFDLHSDNESVAKTMEYAIADWCVAQVAKELGKHEDAEYFFKRSRSYEHFFDKKLHFMRACSSNGEFREPFNPFYSEHRVDDYTEGNAWQYTWLVPHDVNHFVELFGGSVPFTIKLDSLFVATGYLGKDASPDISGLIGQYAHGNEPSHHICYLYSYIGQQWKTAEKVREILTTMYHNAPAGLCGNEDVGQMSSWYIMSSLGFYQVAPAGGIYVIGSPLMEKAVINVGDGKTFTVLAHNNCNTNKYIQSIKLNNKPYDKLYITHKDIMEGGVLELEMGVKPIKDLGVSEDGIFIPDATYKSL